MNTVPHHIGIIIDGNRRWAQEHHLPAFFGHKRGIANVKRILVHAQKRGVGIITTYGFSTENWNRDQQEVDYLMKLFETFIDTNIDELMRRGIRVRHLGDINRLPKTLKQVIKKAIEQTKNNASMIFQIALNYGGRDEICRAVKKLLRKKINPKTLTIEHISSALDTQGLPDPDLIIRTSGEQRLSGFLLWQASYAELYFPSMHWPAFTTKDFDFALNEFARRGRRFGS